jgi:hypothetical protein
MAQDSVNNIYKSYASTIIQYMASNKPFDTLFDPLSDRIVSQSPNDIGGLLLLLKMGADSKGSNTDIFKKFFDQYASFLASHPDKKRSVSILKWLLVIIRQITAKTQIMTTFIWSLQGFRDLIQFYPRSANGFTAMSDSIFCSVTHNDSMITNIDEIMGSFDPLIGDKSVHTSLMMHIDKILTDNKGYTYEDPRMINRSIMSSTDFCVLILNILIKLMKSVGDDPIFNDVFWKAIDTVYISTYIMRESINRSIHDMQIEITETMSGSDSNHQLLRQHLSKGIEMANRLSQYMDTIDIEYIDTAIPRLIDHIINTKNFNVLTRLITCFGNRTLKTIRVDGLVLAEMILRLLKSQDVPPHNKFFAMRLIMSHNMINQLFSLNDSTQIVTQYILNDVQRLKEIDIIHLVDMLVELSDTPIIMSKDVLELYMYLSANFSEQYTAILKMFLNLSDETKPDAMRDLRCMIETSVLLLKNLPLLGRHSLSYLSDILSFVETICDSKQIIRSCTEPEQDLIAQNDISEFEDILIIFDAVRDNYKEKIIQYVISLIRSLQSEYTVMIDTNSERIMREILEIDFVKEFDSDPSQHKVKVISADSISDDLTDVIKCDLAINPYYVRTGDDLNQTLHIIDRKTLYNMYRTKLNPFTRQPIDQNIIDDFNETPCIKQLRLDALQKINSL